MNDAANRGFGGAVFVVKLDIAAEGIPGPRCQRDGEILAAQDQLGDSARSQVHFGQEAQMGWGEFDYVHLVFVKDVSNRQVEPP